MMGGATRAHGRGFVPCGRTEPALVFWAYHMPPLTGASGSTSRLIGASGGALSSAYGSERKALSVSTCNRLTPVARI